MKTLVGIGWLIPFLIAGAVQGQQPVPVGDEFQVNTYTSGIQHVPAVAVDPGGTFVVVWGGYYYAAIDIRGQRYAQDGVPIGAEFRVNSTVSEVNDAASVAAAANGNFVVVWCDTGMRIMGRRFGSDGAPIGNEFQVSSYITDYQFGPAVEVDPDGAFVVVWQSNYSSGTDNDLSSIQGRRYASDGTVIGGEFQINTYTTGAQWVTSVAVDSDGDFIVVWGSSGSSGTDDLGASIQGQRYASDGTVIGGEFQINTYTTGSQGGPSVAVDSDDGFVVVWISYGASGGSDNDSGSIQGQRFASDGTTLGGEFQINTYTTNSQSHPSVAVDSEGDFVVVWNSDGSSGPDKDFRSIQGQRYASDGSASGSEFQINTYTTDNQLNPTVAIAPSSGDFLAVWGSGGSSGTDDDSWSIQGQRFAVSIVDLSISKDDAVLQATPGLWVTYTIVATNNGSADLASVSVADSFAAELTCGWTSFAVGGAAGNTAGSGDLSDTLSMPAGSSVTYTVTCDIDPTATGTLSNTATISSAYTELNLDDNSATDDDTVLIPEADLRVIQSDAPDPVFFNESLTYTVGVRNEGPSLATSILLVDALPPEVDFVSVSGPGWLCNEIGAAVACSLPSLNVGAAPDITLTVTAPAFAGVISNDAAVGGAEIDPNPGNDTSSETTTPRPPVLFADGFESGDTSAWSGTVP